MIDRSAALAEACAQAHTLVRGLRVDIANITASLGDLDETVTEIQHLVEGTDEELQAEYFEPQRGRLMDAEVLRELAEVQPVVLLGTVVDSWGKPCLFVASDCCDEQFRTMGMVIELDGATHEVVLCQEHFQTFTVEMLFGRKWDVGPDEPEALDEAS